MRIFFCCAYCWALLACSNNKTPVPGETSYWQLRKESFAANGLEHFEIDTLLEASYKNFNRVHHTTIDSVVGFGTPYLYSWQPSNVSLAAFTVVVDHDEHGLSIIYFVFDANNRLLSAVEVASKSSEGGIVYETRSRLIAKDTLYKTTAATTQWDLSKPDPWNHRLTNTKGDSTFYSLVILPNGKIVEQQIAENKQLNL